MLTTSLRIGFLFASLLAISATGCAKHHEPTTAQRAKQAHGEISENEKLTATVDTVDQANRTIILRDDKGHRFSMDADQATLQSLRPNDQIKVQYQEVLAFALEDPKKQTSLDQTKVEESAEQTADNAVQVGRRVTTTVQIVSVAPHGTAVEFKLPEGPVRTVAIEDEKNQKEVEALRPGDSVRVTFTEKLKLAVDESNAT